MVLEFQRTTTTQTLHLLLAQATVAMLELYFILFCLFFYFFFESAANIMICFCPIIERQSQDN